jgi:hypothetical protein
MPVGVVPVCRRVADAGHALDVPQHDGVGAAGPGQFRGMLEKGLPQIAVVITVFGVARCFASQLITPPVTMLAIVTSVVAAG